MESCSGGNLQQCLQKESIELNPCNFIKIVKDVTSGMSHVHREGVVHCDLACRNLLVSWEGQGSFSVKVYRAV